MTLQWQEKRDENLRRECMTEKVAWNKSSLLLRNILQKTQTFQLFTMNIKLESIYISFLTMPNWKAWVERPSGLIKRGHRAQALKVRFQNYVINLENAL